MKTDDKALVVCKEAGVEIGTGTMVLIATMAWIYNAMHNLGEMIIGLMK